MSPESTERSEDVPLGNILDAVTEDPDLTPVEKETVMRVSSTEGILVVYTERRGLMRRLLLHDETGEVRLRIGSEGKRVRPARYDGGSVTGVEAVLPLGVLKIQASCRETSNIASVVSDQVLDNDPRGEDDG